MENILLLDTSIASLNKGDDVIMESVRRELFSLLKNNFVLTLPTQVSSFSLLQCLRRAARIKKYSDCRLKFVGGTNILTPRLFAVHPSWNVGPLSGGIVKGSVLVGVGSGGKKEDLGWYSKYIYKKVLSRQYVHSVRDERTKIFLESLGLRAENTGCVTMWDFTPKKCAEIPREKSNSVVFTITASSKYDSNDGVLVRILKKAYTRVYFWPQGVDDIFYANQFLDMEGIYFLPPSLDAYRDILEREDVDYIGTRIHGGIFAMRHLKRAIILVFDDRVREMAKTSNFNWIEKADLESSLENKIFSRFSTNLTVPFEAINRWKSQFSI